MAADKCTVFTKRALQHRLSIRVVNLDNTSQCLAAVDTLIPSKVANNPSEQQTSQASSESEALTSRHMSSTFVIVRNINDSVDGNIDIEAMSDQIVRSADQHDRLCDAVGHISCAQMTQALRYVLQCLCGP